jgi:hypothetical protein
MQSPNDREHDAEEPIPLSVRGTSPGTSRRKRWSSAPPPPMPTRRSNRLAMTVFGAVWVAIGVASIAYVAQHADHVATSEAR